VELIERLFDVVIRNLDMEDLHTMLVFTVFMGCIDHHIEEDISA